MLIANPKTDEYLLFVGATTRDEETGYQTTTDKSSGQTITYRILDTTDGGIVCSVDNHGQAELDSCPMRDFIDAYATIIEEGPSLYRLMQMEG